MKKELLIQKAIDLGFKSKIIGDKPWKHSQNEKLRYYLWIMGFKLWIFEQYKIYISIEFYDSTLNYGFGYTITNQKDRENNDIDMIDQAKTHYSHGKPFDSEIEAYEKAFEYIFKKI